MNLNLVINLLFTFINIISTCNKNIILLFDGNLPSRTSFKYYTIPFILPSKPCNACTFKRMLLDKELREIYFI